VADWETETIARRPPHSEGIESRLRLALASGVGPVAYRRLVEHFGSADEALAASAHALQKVPRIGKKMAAGIRAARELDIDAELAQADRLGVWLIHIDDPRYPAPLRALADAPPVLYVKGTLERSDALAVAIVGSRRCSTYGREQAGRFAHLLASAGFTIVSGMARGIDTAAHRGALAASGRTIAVQGCGLGKIFPAENAELFEQIAQNGACISELPLTYDALAQNFPGRNRIIAGLSLAVLVVEAAAGSGALITAQAAVDNNRDVMAVPGRIDSGFSRGCHRLIRDGARLVEGIEDVMEVLGPVGRTLGEAVIEQARRRGGECDEPLFEVARFNLSDVEKAIYGVLDGEPKHVEEIIAETGLEAGAVGSALIQLRLKGLVRQLPGNLFVRPSAGSGAGNVS